MKVLHVIDKDGEIVRGVPAFTEVWAELPAYRFLAAIARLPGVRFLLDQLYIVFARQRYKRRAACATNR